MTTLCPFSVFAGLSDDYKKLKRFYFLRFNPEAGHEDYPHCKQYHCTQ